MADIKSQVLADMADARKRKEANRALIHSAFPSQASPQPNYMGSQSTSPTKQDNYPDEYGTPIDRSLYNQFP